MYIHILSLFLTTKSLLPYYVAFMNLQPHTIIYVQKSHAEILLNLEHLHLKRNSVLDTYRPYIYIFKHKKKDHTI